MYYPLEGPEKGLVHSYYEYREIEEIFSVYQNVNMCLDAIGRWIISGEK